MPGLFNLPTKLDDLDSEALSQVSAELTGQKDGMLAEYKNVQAQLHERIDIAQKAERQERIKNDPAYWDKHQGIGDKGVDGKKLKDADEE